MSNDLHKQLKENNDRYWRVRNNVKKNQQQARESDNRHKKVQCRKATKMMIKNGSIIKTACEICGNKKSEVHHTDYNNPESVMFLCRKHHLEWHKNNIPIY